MLKLEVYQKEVSDYFGPFSKNDGMLLYWSTGSGKSIGAINIAEKFLECGEFQVVVILKNSNLENNFVNELNFYYGEYFFNKFRKNKYKFLKFSQFKEKDFEIGNNDLIIVDEVHNYLGNSYYDVFMEKFVDARVKKGRNVKLLAMSATPIFDNCMEIFDLINFMNMDKVVPNGNEAKKNGFLEKYENVNTEELEIKGSTHHLTVLGEKVIKEHLHGKISFVNILDYSLEGFPDRSIVDVSCEMSREQFSYYKSSIEQDFSLGKKEEVEEEKNQVDFLGDDNG